MDLIPSRFQINKLLRGYRRKDFENRHSRILATILEKIIYHRDVGVVLRSIGETIKAIEPDETVDYRRFATGEIAKRIVWKTDSSIRYRLLRRRKLPPDLPDPGLDIPMLPGKKEIADQNIIQLLSDSTIYMTARDAGIFLGILAARYIMSCPRELYKAWVDRENMDRFWSLFLIGTMEGELMMSIDF